MEHAALPQEFSRNENKSVFKFQQKLHDDVKRCVLNPSKAEQGELTSVVYSYTH